MDGALIVNPPHPPTYMGVEVGVAMLELRHDGTGIAHLLEIGGARGWAVQLAHGESDLLAPGQSP